MDIVRSREILSLLDSLVLVVVLDTDLECAELTVLSPSSITRHFVSPNPRGSGAYHQGIRDSFLFRGILLACRHTQRVSRADRLDIRHSSTFSFQCVQNLESVPYGLWGSSSSPRGVELAEYEVGIWEGTARLPIVSQASDLYDPRAPYFALCPTIMAGCLYRGATLNRSSGVILGRYGDRTPTVYVPPRTFPTLTLSTQPLSALCDGILIISQLSPLSYRYSSACKRVQITAEFTGTPAPVDRTDGSRAPVKRFTKLEVRTSAVAASLSSITTRSLCTRRVSSWVSVVGRLLQHSVWAVNINFVVMF
ncbi:hypothetical protein RRG08_053325 [Elysia crispata]|uniref:Uncharacterized protein n=1 Tax=Elysia crispata TaxID=231223 RepID=A0AAE1DJ06_9GAST|nr:hypothetical protein RRG08_053325 [Elysia crispata]